MVTFTQSLNRELLLISGVTVITCLVLFLVLYMKWSFGYWKRIGLYQVEPSIPFGNATQLILGKQAFFEMFVDWYKEFKLKGLRHGGGYFLTRKIYLPIDLDIVKNIMIQDFEHFVNHGMYVNETVDPLTGHLFSLKGEKWKILRQKLSPTFSSGKLKTMSQTMVKHAKYLEDILVDAYDRRKPIDIRDVMARFATDVSGSTAFGFEINSLKNSDSKFREIGIKIFKRSYLGMLRNTSQFCFSNNILTFIKHKLFTKELYDFFLETVKRTVQCREKNNIKRKDLMNYLMELKNEEKHTDNESYLEQGEIELNMNQLTAQVFVFFGASFDTSSSTMALALYELARNPKIQKVVQQEIDTVLDKYENELTYDAIMEMPYMTKVINETLRLYPALALLTRECNKSYKVPDSDIIIEAGTLVVISTFAIHRDPKYFPNPDVFNPENFSTENIAARHPFSFLPFGDGPRICIGQRFGILQIKIGLASLLKNFTVTLNKNTILPLKFNKNDLLLCSENTIWLDLDKRH